MDGNLALLTQKWDEFQAFLGKMLEQTYVCAEEARDLLTNPLVENGILQVSLSGLPCRGERWFTAAPARATETAKSNLSLKMRCVRSLLLWTTSPHLLVASNNRIECPAESVARTGFSSNGLSLLQQLSRGREDALSGGLTHVAGRSVCSLAGHPASAVGWGPWLLSLVGHLWMLGLPHSMVAGFQE